MVAMTRFSTRRVVVRVLQLTAVVSIAGLFAQPQTLFPITNKSGSEAGDLQIEAKNLGGGYQEVIAQYWNHSVRGRTMTMTGTVRRHGGRPSPVHFTVLNSAGGAGTKYRHPTRLTVAVRPGDTRGLEWFVHPHDHGQIRVSVAGEGGKTLAY
jgi:hypothetical protein